jgi:hypothetical protein
VGQGDGAERDDDENHNGAHGLKLPSKTSRAGPRSQIIQSGPWYLRFVNKNLRKSRQFNHSSSSFSSLSSRSKRPSRWRASCKVLETVPRPIPKVELISFSGSPAT